MDKPIGAEGLRLPPRREAQAGQLRSALRRLLRPVRYSLRARVALGVGLPILLSLSLLSVMHYWRERHLLEEQARLTATQFSRVVMGSLRYSMLVRDRRLLAQTLTDISATQTIAQAQIVNLTGQVVVDSGPARQGQVQRVVEPGCTACHRRSPETRPTTAVLSTEGEALRIAMPIDADPECAACHPATKAHLGILLVDVPLRILWPHVLRDLKTDLAMSGGITLLMTVGVYLLLNRLVVKRVEAFRRPLAEYTAGRFGARLPTEAVPDEIGEVASAFNRMADQLERHAQQERELSALRQRAIVEERERIARELHDGLAQVLGYVNTKATAVRLLLKKRQTRSAEEQLLQLEDAARKLFVDVREAILGLKMTGRAGMHLAAMLREYAAHFSRLSDLPVHVTIAPEAEHIALPPETELQVLRIAQEALANVRKHASASAAWLSLLDCGQALQLTIGDDGVGFEPDHTRQRQGPRFGLSTMRERAEAIGAELRLDSCPGAGTRVTVWLSGKEG